MAKVAVTLNDQTVILNFGSFSEEVDVDELTSINYNNLFGEAVTVSALLNRIGILKAEAESVYSSKVLDAEVYYATLSKRYRREANISGGKFTVVDDKGPATIKLTDASLDAAILLDLAYQNKKKAVIEAKKNLSFMDSLYWAIQSKDKKLSVLMKATTPKEFYDELIEGEINGIMITKAGDTWTKR